MLRLVLPLTLLAGPVAMAATALMPMPVQVESGSGALAIDGTFVATAAGCPDPRMDAALRRFTARISRQTGIVMGVTPADAGNPTLRVDCTAAGAALPALGEDESYTLDVTK